METVTWHRASTLHQLVWGLEGAAILMSIHDGPLIFLDKRNRSRLDWLAAKTLEKVSPLRSLGRAWYLGL